MLLILISSLCAIAHAQNINCPISHKHNSANLRDEAGYDDQYSDFGRNENDGQCASSPLNTESGEEYINLRNRREDDYGGGVTHHACAMMITYDTPKDEFTKIDYNYPAFHYGAFTESCTYSDFNEGCFAYENHDEAVSRGNNNIVYTGDGSLSDNNITIVCCCETDMCTQKLDCANIAELAEAIIDSKTNGIPYEDWDKYQCAMCDEKLIESNDEWSKTSKLLIMILVPIGFVVIGLIGYCLGKGKMSARGYKQASSDIKL